MFTSSELTNDHTSTPAFRSENPTPLSITYSEDDTPLVSCMHIPDSPTLTYTPTNIGTIRKMVTEEEGDNELVRLLQAISFTSPKNNTGSATKNLKVDGGVKTRSTPHEMKEGAHSTGFSSLSSSVSFSSQKEGPKETAPRPHVVSLQTLLSDPLPPEAIEEKLLSLTESRDSLIVKPMNTGNQIDDDRGDDMFVSATSRTMSPHSPRESTGMSSSYEVKHRENWSNFVTVLGSFCPQEKRCISVVENTSCAAGQKRSPRRKEPRQKDISGLPTDRLLRKRAHSAKLPNSQEQHSVTSLRDYSIRHRRICKNHSNTRMKTIPTNDRLQEVPNPSEVPREGNRIQEVSSRSSPPAIPLRSELSDHSAIVLNEQAHRASQSLDAPQRGRAEGQISVHQDSLNECIATKVSPDVHVTRSRVPVTLYKRSATGMSPSSAGERLYNMGSHLLRERQRRFLAEKERREKMEDEMYKELQRHQVGRRKRDMSSSSACAVRYNNTSFWERLASPSVTTPVDESPRRRSHSQLEDGPKRVCPCAVHYARSRSKECTFHPRTLSSSSTKSHTSPLSRDQRSRMAQDAIDRLTKDAQRRRERLDALMMRLKGKEEMGKTTPKPEKKTQRNVSPALREMSRKSPAKANELSRKR